MNKLLTEVLSQATNRPAPRQGGGTILAPENIIGTGNSYIYIFEQCKQIAKAFKSKYSIAVRQ